MPAANWISEQRGGRVVNVSRGVIQMLDGSNDPSAGLHPRVFLHCFGHSSVCLDQLHVFDTVTKGLQLMFPKNRRVCKYTDDIVMYVAINK